MILYRCSQIVTMNGGVNMDAKKIGKKIKTLRESKNISREKFANSVNISTSALSMYETGQRIPRDEVKLRIARYFETSIEDIFFTN